MDTLKLATDWAKSEVFSSSFFILFGLLFVIASTGFWQIGKTDIAKAYIIPTSLSGVLLLIIGFGLLYTNVARITEFETAYKSDSTVFFASEIKRSQATLNEYKVIVFTTIPLIIAACALTLTVTIAPTWRAYMITTIAMMIVILLVDGTAHARIEAYCNQLILLENPERPKKFEGIQ